MADISAKFSSHTEPRRITFIITRRHKELLLYIPISYASLAAFVVFVPLCDDFFLTRSRQGHRDFFIFFVLLSFFVLSVSLCDYLYTENIGFKSPPYKQGEGGLIFFHHHEFVKAHPVPFARLFHPEDLFRDRKSNRCILLHG